MEENKSVLSSVGGEDTATDGAREEDVSVQASAFGTADGDVVPVRSAADESNEDGHEKK